MSSPPTLTARAPTPPPTVGGGGRPRPSGRFLRVGLAALTLLAVGVATLLLTRPEPPLPGLVRDPAPQVEGLTFHDVTDPTAPREVGLTPAPGELLLAYFGYLSCPDVCPLTMMDIARAQDQVGPGPSARTTVAFVTLDPGRDDPERLRGYLDHFFRERGGSVLPLVAPDDTALTAATDRLGVQWAIEDHAPGDDRYDVAHSAIIYVIDDTGTVVRELPFGTTANDVARVIRASLP
jgi:protein SCO1